MGGLGQFPLSWGKGWGGVIPSHSSPNTRPSSPCTLPPATRNSQPVLARLSRPEQAGVSQSRMPGEDEPKPAIPNQPELAQPGFSYILRSGNTNKTYPTFTRPAPRFSPPTHCALLSKMLSSELSYVYSFFRWVCSGV